MKESIKRRLERLEETLERDPLAKLRRLMELDAPVIWETPEHAAAIAEGRDAPVLYPDEPWPENPIL